MVVVVESGPYEPKSELNTINSKYHSYKAFLFSLGLNFISKL
ncbi:hypothetical protein FDC49_18550 [Clostridium sporogenes]|nr:hypothetical protein [Clostridium lundense]NFE66959.1 hypothetical protein [Clostridium sporogenes]NFG98507.1 hypothetical protein [Clostridium sporogenes]NFH31925.1 hypothetical protein [Clostridium sporogenes]NFL21700.1 hypothetical protein [Clostridium sporogenes]